MLHDYSHPIFLWCNSFALRATYKAWHEVVYSSNTGMDNAGMERRIGGQSSAATAKQKA
jgi:hypothetical protein